MSFSVKGVTIGAGRTYVVAEMAWSHDGDRELALEIVHGAARAGTDCISVHMTNLPAYMVPHYGRGKGRVSSGKEDTRIYSYLCDINIRDEWWPEIFVSARENDLAVAAMPNDLPSLELARRLDPDMYTIHAASFTEEGLVRAVAGQKKPLLLRVGGATLGEIERALAIAAEEGAAKIVLLHGQQNYPTRIEDTGLCRLAALRETFGIPVGLADHIDADDPLATQIPLMALPLGACMIEKHITHDRSKKGEDHESALNPNELADFILRLRKAEKALGTSYFETFSDSQLQYRLVSRKRIVAAKDISAGKKIDPGDVTCKRSDRGLFPEDLTGVIGRTAAVDIEEDEGIILDLLT